MIFRRTKTYLIDENVKMSSIDIQKMNKSKVINSTDIFRKGEPDEKLTARAKQKGKARAKPKVFQKMAKA